MAMLMLLFCAKWIVLRCPLSGFMFYKILIEQLFLPELSSRINVVTLWQGSTVMNSERRAVPWDLFQFYK